MLFLTLALTRTITYKFYLDLIMDFHLLLENVRLECICHDSFNVDELITTQIDCVR